MMLIVPPKSSATFGGPCTVTPIMMSAPIWRAMSAGKLFFNPPSTSTMSPILTGEKAAGIAIEARMACARRPLWKSYSELSMIFVATQAKGIGRSRVKSIESV